LEEDTRVDLGIEIAGIRLKNPLLVCSGTFGNAREYSEWIDIESLGGLITKAVTLRPCNGNPPPRLWEVPSGLLNSIGLENGGLEVFIEKDLKWLSGLDLPVWVNVAGFSDWEYVEISRQIAHSGLADAIELNISCPNVKKGGIQYSSHPEMAAGMVEKVREEVDMPLFVKLSPRVTDIKEMAIILEKAGADGLSLINTVPAMAIDVDTARPRLANVTGGLSGPAIHPIAVMSVWEVAGVVDIPIVGMGGIWSGSDALELMMAGATAVAVGTLNFSNPGATLEILQEIEDFMTRKDIISMSEVVDLTRRRYFPTPLTNGQGDYA
jgi:dihydroorotate dehydrogenase (NAD+) catalytic subunit